MTRETRLPNLILSSPIPPHRVTHSPTESELQMLSAGTQTCIEACLICYSTCLGMASNHCLAVGGPHVEQEHFRLMLACAEVCRTHAHLMLLGSPHAEHLVPECAEIATRCAESCEKVGDMDSCVAACRACAESCSRTS